MQSSSERSCLDKMARALRPVRLVAFRGPHFDSDQTCGLDGAGHSVRFYFYVLFISSAWGQKRTSAAHKPMSAKCQKQHIAKKDAQKERPPGGQPFRIHTLPSGGSLTLLFAPIFLANLRVADELATLTVAGVRFHRPLNCSGGGCCNKSGHRQGRK